MTEATRVEMIRKHLEEALAPLRLDITDDSHLHAGHAGAQSGKGHFSVHIVTAEFENQTPVARHRMVYQILAELMESDIHALSIQALTPTEAAAAPSASV